MQDDELRDCQSVVRAGHDEDCVDAAAEDLRADARTFGLLLCALGDWKGAVQFVASIDAAGAAPAEGAE